MSPAMPPTAHRPLPTLFVIGYPSDVGGANTELWHTVKLWRRFGLGVTLIPTWRADRRWRARLDAIGCRTVEVVRDDEWTREGRRVKGEGRGEQGDAAPLAPRSSPVPLLPSPFYPLLHDVPGLPGGIVVAFCNTRFLAVAERILDLGCKVIWAGCMNWLFPEERLLYRRRGVFHRYVFQSRYQADQLSPQLARFGYQRSQGHLIRGAFDVAEFPLRPRAHRRGERFVVGRVSRAEPDKFPRELWQTFRGVPHPLSVKVLGFSTRIREKVGPPPPSCETFAPGGVPVGEFLSTLHAMVQANDQAVENWPRVGLEAMASGVPLVVENKGGWREMLRHERTGLLCDSREEMSYQIARLAYDEQFRIGLGVAARQAVEAFCEPAAWWQSWKQLLEGLGDECGQRSGTGEPADKVSLAAPAA